MKGSRRLWLVIASVLAALIGAVVGTVLVFGAWALTAQLLYAQLTEGCFVTCGDVWTVRGIALLCVALGLLAAGIAAVVARALLWKAGRYATRAMLAAAVPVLVLVPLSYVAASDYAYCRASLSFPLTGDHVVVADTALVGAMFGDPPCAPPQRTAGVTLPRHACSELATLRSMSADHPAMIYFSNETTGDLMIDWVGYDGERTTYERLEPGRRSAQDTFEGHVWLVSSDAGCVGAFVAEPDVVGVVHVP